MDGRKLPLRMKVDYISFSAHVDGTQNRAYINEVNPSNLVRLFLLIIIAILILILIFFFFFFFFFFFWCCHRSRCLFMAIPTE